MELKFRAWHTVNKVMFQHKDIPVLLKNAQDDTVWKYMLWAGKDRNGDDLYEKDIIKVMAAKSGSTKRSDCIGIIEWRGHGLGGFTVILVIKGERWAYGSIDFTTMTKIGNEFEDPHLLA